MTRSVRRPLEIRIAALLLALAGPVFLIYRVLRQAVDHSSGGLAFPAVVAVLELAAAGALFAGLAAARPIAMALAVLVALVQLLVLLSGAPWPTLVVSGLLAAGHVYVLVLLSTGPARDYRQGGTHE